MHAQHVPLAQKYILHESTTKFTKHQPFRPPYDIPTTTPPLASLDRRSSVLAVIRRPLGHRLGLAARLRPLELLADRLYRRSARPRDTRGAAKVGVDAREDLSIVRLDVLDDDGAGDGVLAVAAGAVELAEVLLGVMLAGGGGNDARRGNLP